MKPVGVYAILKVKDGHQQEFISAMRKMQEAVRADEPGCLAYDMYQGEDDTTFVMLERYQSEEALGAHRGTPHMKQLGADLQGVMAAAPDVKVFHEPG